MEADHEYCATANLPPFNPVSMRLLDVLSKEDAVVEQVAELLRLDAAFVGDILRLANSPVFGFQSQIRNLAHAIVLLGTKRLRSLIATASVMRSSDACDLLAGFWRHSVASAFVAAELASACGENPDQAYTEALLHDVRARGAVEGYITPEWQAPERYAEIVDWACRISDALGFHVAPKPAQTGAAEEVLRELPEPVRNSVDPKLLTRVIQEKITAIHN